MAENIVGLRPEARFFQLDALHWGQRVAGRRLLALLKDAIADADRADAGEHETLAPTWLDAHRNSRVAFLSGPRGSGKTSTVLSLVAESHRRTPPASAPAPGAASADEQVLAELRRELNDWGRRLVWLEPIDLDPLPESTSFLAAVLARLVKSVREREGGISGQGAMTTVKNAWREIERIQRDITIAWDSNLAARRASLDPDSYVAEVVRAEGLRLGLHSRLAKAIRDLRHGAWSGEPRLFVLLIDDFDLEPAHAVEILRILRTLSIPGFFTIILGDLAVAEDMFESKVAGRIHELARGSLSADRAADRLVHTSPAEIAANAVRKMVPPSHRIQLRHWHPREAACYAPTPSAPTLRDLAAEIPLHHAEGVIPGEADGAPTLGTFLFVESVRSTEQRHRLAYDGSEILHAPPRHIMDFWFVLRDLASSLGPRGRSFAARRETRALISALVAELRSAVAEDPALSRSAQRRVLSCVQLDPLRGDWEVSTTRLSLKAAMTAGMVLDITPAASTNEGVLPIVPQKWEKATHRVRVRRFRRWLFRTNKTREVEPLGHRTAAALMAIRDLVTLTGEGIVENELKDESMNERAYTEWELGARDPIRVPWAVDIWKTFWAFGRFSDGLSLAKEIARQVREEESKLDDRGVLLFFAYGWIAAGLSVFRPPKDHLLAWVAQTLDAPPRPGEAASVSSGSPLMAAIDVDPKGWRWSELRWAIHQLVTMFDKRIKDTASDPRLDEMRAWFIGLACMLSPEVGIPGLVFNLLSGREDDAGSFWDSGVGLALAAVWGRTDTGRNVGKRRAERLGLHLLTPQGLAMVNPSLARRLKQPSVNPYEPDAALVEKAWREMTTDLGEIAGRFEVHPINMAAPGLHLCPDVGMILDVLRALPLRENRLALEQRLLYHALRQTDGAQRTKSMQSDPPRPGPEPGTTERIPPNPAPSIAFDPGPQR